MKQRIKETLTWLLTMGAIGAMGVSLCGTVFTGCVIGDGSGEVVPAPGPNPIPTAHCAELNPAQQKTGDSLVALAQKLQAGDVEMIVSIKDKDWQGVNEVGANQAIALYDQALQAAPGHCAALFGRALARGGLLLQDKAVNEVVAQALPKASAPEKAAALPVAQAYKSDRDQAAPLILRIASGLSNVNKPFISAQQERLATEVLPQLDSVIASLNAVMVNKDFSFTYTRKDGSLIEVDAGEVGPVLGGLKVARAVLLLICGYQWEIAKDDSYAWMDRLGNMGRDDFAHLSAAQRSDLDHLTGFFQVGNAFTRVKPEWKAAIQGIPNLLLEAVENTQAGLTYALSESGHPEKQLHDLYRVGTGEGDDVDPKDVAGMIDALERTKKYLKGEVALSYHHGTHTLRLDFPKIFAWDGLQNFLPRFTVRPYEQWFVPLAATDSSYEQRWGVADGISGGLFSGEAFRKVMEIVDLPTGDAIGLKTAANGNLQVTLSEDFNGWFKNSYHGTDMVLAELTPGASPCEFHYVKTSGRVRVRPDIFAGADTYVNTDDKGAGTVALGGTCRVIDGKAEYLVEENTTKARPFYFTDAAGAKTLELDEVEGVVSDLGMAGLTGKIVFKDPTFGGVFPDLNNDNIWSTMQSLDYSGARIDEHCNADGVCTEEIPNNPSDLDVWAHYLFWVDNIF